jgi:cytochrome c oxidase cbb3-type subunit 4
MSYDAARHIAETWGLALLVAGFAIALIYALWPGNRDKFKAAADTPLNDGDDNG